MAVSHEFNFSFTEPNDERCVSLVLSVAVLLVPHSPSLGVWQACHTQSAPRSPVIKPGMAGF
jgi:hypothetical protein